MCGSKIVSLQRVPAHIGSANVTVTGKHSDVQFQVSATVMVNGMENEGERSEVTLDSTVFVPNPSKLFFVPSCISVLIVYTLCRPSSPWQS